MRVLRPRISMYLDQWTRNRLQQVRMRDPLDGPTKQKQKFRRPEHGFEAAEDKLKNIMVAYHDATVERIEELLTAKFGKIPTPVYTNAGTQTTKENGETATDAGLERSAGVMTQQRTSSQASNGKHQTQSSSPANNWSLHPPNGRRIIKPVRILNNLSSNVAGASTSPPVRPAFTFGTSRDDSSTSTTPGASTSTAPAGEMSSVLLRTPDWFRPAHKRATSVPPPDHAPSQPAQSEATRSDTNLTRSTSVEESKSTAPSHVSSSFGGVNFEFTITPDT